MIFCLVLLNTNYIKCFQNNYLTSMKLPKFKLPASDGNIYSEIDFKKAVAVIFVYPKDNTPGCTIEAKSFRNKKEEFQKLGVKLFGLSKDPIKSHEKFVSDYRLNFPLISDEEKELLLDLKVMKEKSMFGKKYMGVERSSFVIKNGEIVKDWRNVKIIGHINDVLGYCRTIV